MSKSWKAALLSAFVFPGSGHYYLKSKVKGNLLAGATLAALILLVSTMVKTALNISTKIQTGEIPLEITVINDAIMEQLTGNPTWQINVAFWLLLICWLFGIFDSYRIGRTLNILEERNYD